MQLERHYEVTNYIAGDGNGETEVKTKNEWITLITDVMVIGILKCASVKEKTK